MVPTDDFTGTLTVLVTVTVCCYTLWLAGRRAPVYMRRCAVATWLLHLSLGVVVWFAFPALIAGDASVYDSQALSLASVMHGGPPTMALTPGKEGFSVVLAAIYWAGGHVPVAGIVLNATAAALVVIVIANAARKLTGNRAGYPAAVLTATLPSLAWWGSQLLREAFVWIALALISELIVTSVKDGLTARRGVALFGTLLMLLTLRAPIAAVISVALIAALLIARPWRAGDSLRWMALIVTSALFIVLMLPRLPALEYLQSQNAETIARSRNALITTATTSYGQTSAPTIGGLVRQLPQTVPFVLFGPFPSQLATSGAWIALVDTASWWMILLLALPGVHYLRRLNGRAAFALLLLAIAILVTIALSEGNFGILIRMRAMAIVLLIPYASAQVSRRLSVEPGTACAVRRSGTRSSAVKRNRRYTCAAFAAADPPNKMLYQGMTEYD